MAAVDGGRKGEEDEESTSKGGEHRAGREGAHKGVITGEGSPYKVALGTDERPLPSNCLIPIFPFSPVTRVGRPRRPGTSTASLASLFAALPFHCDLRKPLCPETARKRKRPREYFLFQLWRRVDC
jgi:hypothetical protein